MARRETPTLWGKTIEQIESERMRAMSSSELGQMYGDRLRPVDPEPDHRSMMARQRVTWVDVENELARRGADDAGQQATVLRIALVAIGVLVLVLFALSDLA